MSYFAEKREVSLKRMGREKAMAMASTIANIVVENNLSICQAEEIFELVVDMLLAYPLRAPKTEVPVELSQTDTPPQVRQVTEKGG